MKQAFNRALLVVGISGAAMLSAPAFAGGLAEPVPEAPVTGPVQVTMPSADWTGGHVGATLGYGRASNGTTSGNGATYGLQGGYDWDFGQWVVGAGLDWDKTNLDLGTGTDKINDIARLKLRVGADLGRTLVYATAGPARASADVGGTSVSDNGWFGGVGADYAINERWTVGGELLTNRFNNFGGGSSNLDATTASLNVGLRF